LQTLRYVLAVHQHGSFARAARALGISQPSLSNSVARLEDELRGSVFVRSSRGVEFTPLGLLVVEQAARVVHEVDNLEQAAQLASGGAASRLRIGLGPELKADFGPKLLEAILERRPQLNLRTEVGDRTRLLPSLQARELDLIFCVRDEAVNRAGLVVRPIITTEGVLVAAPSHPLAEIEGLTPARFLRFPHTGPRNVYYAVEVLLEPKEHEAVGPGYETSDYEVFMPLALSGATTLALPAFAAAPYVRAGVLKLLDMPIGGQVEYVGITTAAADTSPIIRDALQDAVEIGKAITAAQQDIFPPKPP
jgi:DNA-binding transcriptional LysR family regulator